MTSLFYQRFLFGRFCSSAVENLDLRLAKHQEVCLVNECSHMEKYANLLATASSSINLFVRFCIRLGMEVDLGLSLKQLLCLYKECIKTAQYYDDVQAMEQAILTFVLLSKCMLRYEDQNEYEEVLVYGKICVDVAKRIGVKQIERDACYVVGKACLGIKHFQDAAVYCKRSLEMAMDARDKDAVMYACLELGRAYAGLQQYPDAMYHIKNCIKLSKETGNRQVEMFGQLEIGRAYAGLTDYANAIISYTRSIEIAKATGNREVEMCADLEVGRAYAGLKDYDNAITYFNRSIEIAEANGNRDIKMYAYLEVGRAYAGLKDYEIAITSRKRSIEMSEENGNRKIEMYAHLEVGRAYKEILESVVYFNLCIHTSKEKGGIPADMRENKKEGVHNDAILHCRKCTSIAKQIEDKETEKEAYFTLMAIYKYFEQYNEAIACGKKCIEIVKEFGNKSDALDAYILIANVLLLAEQYEESVKYGKIALEISTQTCDSNAEMLEYIFLGIAYRNLKQPENSIFFLKMCIEKSTKYKDKMYEMRAHFELVQIFLSVPLLDEAILHLNKGKSIAQELNSDEYLNKSREYQCVLDVIVGIENQFLPNEQVLREQLHLDIDDASEQEVLDVLAEAMMTNDIPRQRQALLTHYCFCHSKKKYEKALSSLKRLRKLLEKASKLWCDRGILKLYMLMKKFDEALTYCWEILSEIKESEDKVHQSLFYSMFGQLLYRCDQFDDAEKYLREALQCFEIVFASLGSNDKAKISIVDKYFDCYKCLSLVLSVTNQVDEALLVSDGSRARVLKDLLVENFGMKQEENEKDQLDIQAFLAAGNDVIVLFYSLYSDGILLFFSETRDNTFKIVFQEYEMCVKNVEDFLKLIDRVFDELDARQVGKCENRSLDTKQDETERRDEATTDALCAMDTSLCTTGSNSRGETSGNLNTHRNVLKFLYKTLIRPAMDFLDKDEVVIIPDGPLNCVPFAALQDPDTGKYLSETKRTRLAPSIGTLKVLQERADDHHHRNSSLVIGSPLVGTVMMNGEERDIEPLFGALDEALDIAALLGVRALVAAKATKPAVLEKLREGVSVVHIAAHGILSKATIVLATSPEVRATKPIPDEEDYMLTMADVQQAKVRAQLVVLSCCHSGRGEIRAEGVVGMCRAFLASGARAVVASLWAIDDDATLEFMKTFYGHLKTGNTASTSLQLTMQDMRQSERFNKPKYWAPFFLIGDDVTIDFAK